MAPDEPTATEAENQPTETENMTAGENGDEAAVVEPEESAESESHPVVVSTASGTAADAEEPAASSPPSSHPIPLTDRTRTQPLFTSTELPNNSSIDDSAANSPANTNDMTSPRGRAAVRDEPAFPMPARCINPATDVNTRLDTQVEVRVYPCNNSQSSSSKKRFTSFTIKPEGVVIQGSNRARNTSVDLGAEYAMHIGRKLQRYELSDTRACQLLVTTHGKSFWVVPAPEAFSRHSGTCRLLGDRKHPPASHTLQVGDFLRVGSVGVVVIETHDGVENRVLSEEKIQKIMKDTTNSNGGFLDLAETDGGMSLIFLFVIIVDFSPVVAHLFFISNFTQKIPKIPWTRGNARKLSMPLLATTRCATCASTRKTRWKTP